MPAISSLLVNKKRNRGHAGRTCRGRQGRDHWYDGRQADAIVRAFRDLKQTNRTMAAATGQASSSDADPVAQIERLAALRDKGIISAEEFESKKTELMGRL